MRARELGIRIGSGTPGPLNAITDVAGVRVGHTTLVEGEGPLRVGEGPVRTGVTVIRPHDGLIAEEPLFAGFHSLNGNGEVTGLAWLKESGQLMSPIAITNSHSVGVVRDALVAIECRERTPGHLFWSLPVVGETWDGILNDIQGLHVKTRHVEHAYASASGGPVEEGSVGGGTGMICYEFKGGIGTASRVLAREMGGYTVGVLVQANFGSRADYLVNGAPVGRILDERRARAGAAGIREVSCGRLLCSCRRGLNNRHRCHRCSAAATSMRRACRANRPGGGENGQFGRPLEWGHLRRLLDREQRHVRRQHDLAGVTYLGHNDVVEQLSRSAL